MKRRSALSAFAAAIAGFALALGPVSAASAHDYLVGSTPAAGSTVTQPLERVTLSFNDRVLDLSGNGSGTLVTVTGPGQQAKHFETGCATVADTDVSAPVALGGAGDYTITYQVVSADGHTVSSTVPFHYQPPAGAPAAAGSDSTPCGAGTEPAGGPATPASSATKDGGSGESASTAQPTQAPASNDLGIVIGIAVAIVLLALAGVIIVIVTARRKPAEPPVGEHPDDEKGLGGRGGGA